MTRPHYGPTPTVVSVAGVLTQVTNATITICNPGTGGTTKTHITQPIYAVGVGGSPISNGWIASSGFADFYLLNAATVDVVVTIGGVDTVLSYQDVGNVDHGMPRLQSNDIMCDGITDDGPALSAYFASAFFAQYRATWCNPGVCLVRTTFQWPNIDGWGLSAPPGGGTNRLPPFYFQAGTGAALNSIAATAEYLTNGSTQDAGQGGTLRNIGGWGGGFGPNQSHSTSVETTSNTLHGFIIHGSGWKVIDCMSVSANGHNWYIPGVGIDGSTVLPSESHEILFQSVGARYAGLDNIHGGLNAQDGAILDFSKLQYAGRNNINMENGQGWLIMGNHPSWAVGDMIVTQSSWETDISHNYLGSLGEYMDGTGRRSGTVYAVNATGGGPIIISDNRINTNASAGTPLVDPVTPIRISGSESGGTTENGLVYQVGDNVVEDLSHNVIMVEEDSVDGAYPVNDNTSRTGH